MKRRSDIGHFWLFGRIQGLILSACTNFRRLFIFLQAGKMRSLYSLVLVLVEFFLLELVPSDCCRCSPEVQQELSQLKQRIYYLESYLQRNCQSKYKFTGVLTSDSLHLKIRLDRAKVTNFFDVCRLFLRSFLIVLWFFFRFCFHLQLVWIGPYITSFVPHIKTIKFFRMSWELLSGGREMLSSLSGPEALDRSPRELHGRWRRVSQFTDAGRRDAA